jgi:hypothetical protein
VPGRRRASSALARLAGDDSRAAFTYKALRNGMEGRPLAGRKPLGNKPMTVAERQLRFRAAHADGAPKVRYRRPSDRRSRPQRWRDAVAELVSLQDEYRAWLDSLPDNLAESATAQALRAVCDLDLSELDSVEPPRGFGRD